MCSVLCSVSCQACSAVCNVVVGRSFAGLIAEVGWVEIMEEAGPQTVTSQTDSIWNIISAMADKKVIKYLYGTVTPKQLKMVLPVKKLFF